MRKRLIAFVSLALFLAGALVLLSCVTGFYPVEVLFQNISNQPVLIQLRYSGFMVMGGRQLSCRYKEFYAKGLHYSPFLLKPRKPGNKLWEQPPATLPVQASDTTAAFTIPPHATVLVYHDYRGFGLLTEGIKIHVQRTDSSQQVLDAEQLLSQARRFRKGRMSSYWYSIH